MAKSKNQAQKRQEREAKIEEKAAQRRLGKEWSAPDLMDTSLYKFAIDFS